jgi:hypothetical protein
MSNEIEVLTQILLTKKCPGMDRFTAEFYQTFKKDLTSIVLKLVYKIEREGMQLN